MAVAEAAALQGVRLRASGLTGWRQQCWELNRHRLARDVYVH